MVLSFINTYFMYERIWLVRAQCSSEDQPQMLSAFLFIHKSNASLYAFIVALSRIAEAVLWSIWILSFVSVYL